jgi:protein TonB
MELKKSVKADLEWRKPTFFLVGLVISLSIVYLAFEFVGTREKDDNIVCGTRFIDGDIVILHPIDLPPPPIAQQANATDIKITNIGVDAEIVDFTIDAESYEDLRISDIVETWEGTYTTVVPFLMVEIYPEFPGGEEALVEFLYNHVVYPNSARTAGVEGQVYVGFIVEKDGRLTNFTITRSAAPVLDNEVLRVMKLMPKWKPGQQRGKAVRVQFQLPVTFALK